MNTNSIDAALMAKMFLAGARNLEQKKEWINELNVFPVPDGDTGTNMTLTITSAADEVKKLDPVTMESVSTPGLYPCGEGAGYAGGITSSALDGINAALKIISK